MTRGAVTAPALACVAVPAFPLQLVLRAHPEWKDDPVVVVEDDRPLARVLWANRPARAEGIGPGLRFTAAQSLLARLRGVPVADVDTDSARGEVFRLLLSFSPRVEPAPEGGGVFWLDPRGLGRLYPGPDSWAARIHSDLAARSLAASVVLGWRRACLLAVARAGARPRVLRVPEEEAREADDVPLGALELPPDLRRELHALGVTTFGEFRRLPERGITSRFGMEALALHRFAAGKDWTPLRAALPERPVRAEVAVDPPDDDRNRLLFAVKGALHGLADALRKERRGIQAMEITLDLDHAPAHHERIETAAPGLDVVRLTDLVRLRLSATELAAAVERMEITVETRRLTPAQLAVLDTPPRRDPAAAAEAIARVKAAYGRESVAVARLADAHLPEARVRWEPVSAVPEPRPPLAPDGPLPLLRTLLPVPLPLPDLPRHERESWLGKLGAVEAMHGPDRLESRWWDRPAQRDYFLVETRTGAILWIFHDRARRSWHLHGFVD
jgi:protein ImuB